MSLRVLIVEKDPARAEHLSHMLETAEYDVLPLSGFDDASEALSMSRFDAVLVPGESTDSELQNLAARLREQELRSRGGLRTPILACDDMQAARSCSSINAFLPCNFEPAQFGSILSKVAEEMGKPGTADNASSYSDLAIFDQAQFREQMCGDAELMVEIIDLYITESAKQRSQMQSALATGDLANLSRLAHTIKGSLGSLHTPRSRACAQDLELSAKRGDAASSTAAHAALEVELQVLEPVLQAFRNA